jgi:hypothetical protein
MLKLRPPRTESPVASLAPAAFLFLLGAAAALVGDHAHVVTGTTTYLFPRTSLLSHSVPFVWSSPLWFPALVGATTVSLAELRLHLPRPRTDVTPRQGLAGVAAVIGTYVVTALVHAAPGVPATALICTLAVIIWCALGDGPAVICGVLAAVVGPVVEIVLVDVGVFRYGETCDQLFGVGPWLVPLYFAFGVVAALLGELAARPREARRTVRGARLHYP